MSKEEQILGRGKCECLTGSEKREILEGLEILLQMRTRKLNKEKRDEYINVLTTMKSVTEQIIKKVENTPDCHY
jgi:hypothetical protein